MKNIKKSISNLNSKIRKISKRRLIDGSRLRKINFKDTINTFSENKSSIRKKLIISFLILIIVPMVLNVAVIYFNSTKAIKDKISLFSLEIIEQTSRNLDLKMLQINHDIGFIDSNNEIKSIVYKKNYIDDIEKKRETKKVKNLLSSITLDNKDIKKIMLFTASGEKIEDKIHYENGDFWSRNGGFFDTNTYKEVLKMNQDMLWCTGLNGNYKEIAILKHIINEATGENGAVLVILVDQLVFGDILSDVHLGDGTDVVILNGDRKVISHKLGENLGKKLTDEYINDIYGQSDAGKFSTNNNLITYKTIGNGWKILCQVPTNSVVKEIKKVSYITIFIGIISLVIAIGISIIIATNISKPLKNISNLMKKAEEGDLTVKSVVKGEGEIATLSQSFNIMIENIRGLIVDTRDLVELVENDANTVKESAYITNQTSEQVTLAFENITIGTTKQVEDSENTTTIIDDLSGQINNVADNMKNVMGIIENTNQAEKNAMITVNNLNVSSRQLTKILDEIKNYMEKLRKRSIDIIEINKIIENVNKKTNLLALNASIEAARAGEAGRGFTVVAQEIGKLAEQSKNSTDVIEDLISNVEKDILDAGKVVNNAYAIFESQEESVIKTDQSFKNILDRLQEISEQVEYVNEAITNINDYKENAIVAIRNIKDVSEEAAASTQEVLSITQNQNETSNSLQEISEKLTYAVNKLHDSMNKFKV